MRRRIEGRRRPAAVLGALALALVAAGCSTVTYDEASVPTPPKPKREVDFERCGFASLAKTPDGFRLAKRELKALSDNHMGEVVTYRRGLEMIRLYYGPDLYDALEDLDLIAEKVETSDFEFALSTTILAPELQIAVLDEEVLDEPCEDAGVLSKHISRELMLEVLDDFRLEQGEQPS